MLLVTGFFYPVYPVTGCGTLQIHIKDYGCDIIFVPCRFFSHSLGSFPVFSYIKPKPVARTSVGAYEAGIQSVFETCDMFTSRTMITKKFMLF
ncbi:hypothetical protein PMA3_21605 [Pseudomonas silesiensis]|uniref:Uncharacterized protein n=1 Tax=Pseudomonas silesiensis TaxID=1853130 RepID=A0A191YXX8_9PSED|nr:hypothetical protein PMA3_21605 [Pseudomonas silesiensis]